MRSFKTGGLSWQWFLKTGVTVKGYYVRIQLKKAMLFMLDMLNCSLQIRSSPFQVSNFVPNYLCENLCLPWKVVCWTHDPKRPPFT